MGRNRETMDKKSGKGNELKVVMLTWKFGVCGRERMSENLVRTSV